jgi:plasmid replication initiation protein
VVYRRLKDAFERLSGTRMTTNILANGEAILDGFGLIDSFRIVRQTRSGRMSELKVRLSDWAYNIIQGAEVLTLSRDYFRLRKPVDRRVYELARKHCGEQDEWKISLELLHQKTGASSHSREFKSMIRELVQNDHLPDYQVSIEDEMAIFRNRMNGRRQKNNFVIRCSTRRPTTTQNSLRQATMSTTWSRNGVICGLPAVCRRSVFREEHLWRSAKSAIK